MHRTRRAPRQGSVTGHDEPGPARQDDWITQLLDKLDEGIEFVRSKTTEPLAKVARYLIYLILFIVVGNRRCSRWC